MTRQFPTLVRKDAARLWKGYLQQRRSEVPDVRGILAAWMAEQYLLGTEDAGWATMQQLNAKGELDGDGVWAQGDAYLKKLRAFLVKRGYAGKRRGLASGS